MTQEDKEEIFKDFVNKMFEETQDMSSEIQDILDEHFFEIL